MVCSLTGAVILTVFLAVLTLFSCLPVTGPSRDGTIGEDTIRASLISAVSDKLRWRMKEEMDRAQAELDALKRTEEDLKKGHQKLEEMVSRLDQEVVRQPLPFSFFHCLPPPRRQPFFLLLNRFSQQSEVDRNIELLKKKDEELSEALEKMENQTENNDIDDIIVPTAPLYKQILNLYAEENAIEDTIFYLGEALRRGVIDLEVFLKVTWNFASPTLSEELPQRGGHTKQTPKSQTFNQTPAHPNRSLTVCLSLQHVRLLSRKQFQLRALMQKARKTAGLSDLY